MGGGTPLIEANRIGCNVQGFDINPMSAWIVREEIEHLDLRAYHREADALSAELQRELGDFYWTDCPLYGDRNVPVKYFLWVKVIPCERCGSNVDLFPGYRIADDTSTRSTFWCAGHAVSLTKPAMYAGQEAADPATRI